VWNNVGLRNYQLRLKYNDVPVNVFCVHLKSGHHHDDAEIRKKQVQKILELCGTGDFIIIGDFNEEFYERERNGNYLPVRTLVQEKIKVKE